MWINLVISIPILTGVILWMLGRWIQVRTSVFTFLHSCSLICVLAISVIVAILLSHGYPIDGLYGWLSLDRLGAVFFVVISVVSCLTGWYATVYWRSFENFSSCLMVFQWMTAALTLVCVVNDFGTLWLAIESATLCTMTAIAFQKKSQSFETIWSFMLISLTGAALTLFGLILLYYTAYPVFGGDTLAFDHLPDLASQMNPHLLKVCFVFIWVGLGTRAGIVPMHLWLPYVHDRAPEPMSGILTGGLLTVCLYGIFRYKLLLQNTADSLFVAHLFLIFGIGSVAVSIIAMLYNRSFKRLLGYSTIGYIGLVLTAIGIGNLRTVSGALFLLFVHAVIKASMFCLTTTSEQKTDPSSQQAVGRSILIVGAVLVLMGLTPFGPLVALWNMVLGSMEIGSSISKWSLLIEMMGLFAVSTRLLFAWRRQSTSGMLLGVKLTSVTLAPLLLVMLFNIYPPIWWNGLLSNAAFLLSGG